MTAREPFEPQSPLSRLSYQLSCHPKDSGRSCGLGNRIRTIAIRWEAISISQPRSAASLECFPADQIRLWTAIWLIYPAMVSSFFFCCVVKIFFAAFLKINANVQTGFLVIFIFDSWSRVRSGFLGREVLPATLQPFCYFVTRAAPKRMRKSE